MATYRLSSLICPAGPRGHRVTAAAVAPGQRREEVQIDVPGALFEAESRRAALLVLLEDRLRRRGHDVADPFED